MIVYTCITANIDPLPEPAPGCTCICFTDTPQQANGWQIRSLLKQFDNPTLTARYHKTQAPLFLEGNKFLWQDGKVILKDAKPLFQRLSDKDFLFFEHPRRSCIYEEGKRVIELGKESPSKIRNQCGHYKELGHVTKRLFETCVFLMNKNERTVKLLSEWWGEIETYSFRDQISLPVVLQNSGLVYECLKDPYNQPNFTVNHHPFFERSVSHL